MIKSKTLFSLGGGGLFLKGYLREKIFPENFFTQKDQNPYRSRIYLKEIEAPYERNDKNK